MLYVNVVILSSIKRYKIKYKIKNKKNKKNNKTSIISGVNLFNRKRLFVDHK